MKITQEDFPLALVLTKPLKAHLASSLDSLPRSSPLWFFYENNHIYLFDIDTDSFIKRLAIDILPSLKKGDFYGVLAEN